MINTEYGSTRTHEDEGRVQVFVVLLRIVSIKLVGLLSIDGEEVGSGVVGPERFNEFLEGGMEASRSGCQYYLATLVKWSWRTTLNQSERPSALPAEVLLAWSPQGRTSPSAVIMARAKSLALDRPKSGR